MVRVVDVRGSAVVSAALPDYSWLIVYDYQSAEPKQGRFDVDEADGAVSRCD